MSTPWYYLLITICQVYVLGTAENSAEIQGLCDKPETKNLNITSPVKPHYTIGDVVSVSCDTGHCPSSSNIVCENHNGTLQWYVTAQCLGQYVEPSASNLSIASNETESFDTNDVVTVSCDPGYRPSSANITCIMGHDGLPQWNKTVRCIRLCDNPKANNLSITSKVKPYYDIGDVVSVSCDTGYRPSSNNIVCENHNGTLQWNMTAQCLGQCMKPSASNLSITSKETEFYDIGDVVTVICDPGYRPSSPNIACITENDGLPQWNENIQCIRLCDNPKANNLNITSQVKTYYDIDDVVSVSCDTGYRPSSNNIVCENHNGTLQWNMTAQCLGQCMKPSASNLSITSKETEFYDIGDVVTVICDPGYRPSSPNIACITENDGLPQWNENIQCIRLCDNPKANNLNITSQVKPYYDIDDVVSVSCDTGYRPSSNNIVCENHNGTLQWNMTAQCLGQCMKPSASNLSITSKETEFYDIGDVVTVICDPGYRPSSPNIACITENDGLPQWNENIQCIRLCDNPKANNLNITSQVKPYYDIGDVVSVSCDTGYRPSSNNIVCENHNGTLQWNMTAQCLGQCMKPSASNLSTTSNETEFYDIGDVVTVICDPGYRPSSPNITCITENDGLPQWNENIQCIRLCDNPKANNLNITSQVKPYYDIDDVVSVSCDTGYRPSSNNIVCENHNGTLQWNMTAQCLGQCMKPSASNLSITSNETEFYDIGDVVTVICDPGYRPSSPNITCITENDGLPQWNENIQCIRLCDNPKANNLNITSQVKPYYDIGDVVSVSCDTGYRPSSNNIVCENHNGTLQWNMTAQCLGQCMKPSASNLSITSNETEFYDIGDVVTVICDPGYRPSSPNIACITENDGLPQWNENIQCIRLCDNPKANNLNITSQVKPYYDIGDVVSVSCDTGYRPSSNNIVCENHNGTLQWNMTAQCLGQCMKPSASNLSTTSNETEFYDIGDVVTVICDPGYRPSSPNIACITENDGLPQWNENIQCIRLCDNPKANNLNITSQVKPYYDIGDVVSVSCDTGYRPSSNNIVCENHNGTLQWNMTAQCLGQCMKPSASNLSITSNETEFYDIGDVVTAICDPGYRPSSPNITCITNHDGLPQWNENVRCIRQCVKPSASNLSITSNETEFYDIGNVVPVSCDPGYRPLSPNITCIMDHNGLPQWNETIQCIRLCDNPEAKNLNITSQIKPHYDIGDVVSVSCDTGYHPSSDNIVCENHNGTLQWNVTAQCLAQCTKPNISNVKTLSEEKDHYNVNESVAVTCQEGHWPSHNKVICVSDGDGAKWNRTSRCIGVAMTDLNVTSTSISFQIQCNPSCHHSWTFTARCEDVLKNETSRTKLDNKINVTNVTNVTFTNLRPFSMYRINTTLHRNKISSLLETREIRTNESVPDRPTVQQNITMEDNTIRWELSDIWGKVTGFQMNISAWREYNATFILKDSIWFFRNETEYKIPLQHGTNYTVTLQGFTLAGAGNVTTLLVETEIGDPPCHVEKAMNQSTLHLLRVYDLYGPISFYEIIVIGGQDGNMSADCLTFESSHYNSSWTSSHYTAAVLPAQNLTGSRTFILGDNEYYNGFHNAPLTSEHNYTVYIRVTSQWKQVNKSSCAYAGFLTVTAAEPASNTVQIIAGSISAVILLLVLLILVVVWRRRFSGKSSRSPDIPLKAKTGPGKKRDIPVDRLLGVVKRFRVMEISDTNDDEEHTAILSKGRYKEYEELPGVLMHLCSVALSQENQAKNRYKKVLPYDDSRVVLRSSHSRLDYINASYIDGYKVPKYYIATQGPIPETVCDFWSMVWQENSSVIVMLTGLEEHNKVKCERYWPEQSQTYGDITVSVQQIVHTGAFTIRSFRLKKMQSTVQMMVEQIHYLRWPDHGVPKNTSDMVHLVELVNKCNSPGSGPVIVHCSAGIGRTGTFLALDILLKMARAVKKVNVYNCVLEMRKQRLKMVQEKEQYIFLYDVLLETLLCGSTGIPVSEIHKHTHCMSLKNPATSMSGFDREFQALEKITELYQIYPCKEGKKLENQTKNSNPDILPGDHWRPILLSALTRHGAPGYINAVFVNSNSQDDALIVTQMPMKKTLADFWALVWDYKCTAVVMMQREQDLKENGVRFWPEKGETSYGAFKVRATERNPGYGYTALTLNLRKTNEPSDSNLDVRLFQLDSWPQDQSLPENPAALISLIGEAEKCLQQTSDSHILVTCCDGAGQSGLFCAGVIICDQIRSDGCLDVSQAVRSLRRRRCQFIPNVEQYAFCYTLAQSYLDSFQTYGNFK